MIAFGRDAGNRIWQKKLFERIESAAGMQRLRREYNFFINESNADIYAFIVAKIKTDAKREDASRLLFIWSVYTENIFKENSEVYDYSARTSSDTVCIIRRYGSLKDLDAWITNVEGKMESLAEGVDECPSFRTGIGIHKLEACESFESCFSNALSAADYALSSGKTHADSKDAEKSGEAGDGSEDVVRTVKRGEFNPYYCPVANVGSGEIISAIISPRLKDPKEGVSIPPEQITLMIQKGVIMRYELQMLDKSCEMLAGLRKIGRDDITLIYSFNEYTLQDDKFREKFEEELRKHQLPLKAVIVGVMADDLLFGKSRLSKVIGKLTSAGIKTALCGCNFLNISPSIFLDNKFGVIVFDDLTTRNLGEQRWDCIVETIVQMAHKIGSTVIFSSVETRDQVIKISSLGADGAQGKYYSSPLPDNIFYKLLKR